MASKVDGGGAVKGIKGHDYTWSKSWIEFKAPDAPGVYCLRDKEGKALLIGKGKVRERLLVIGAGKNSTDEAIWGRGRTTFQFELTTHPADREAELIQELKPSCNPIAHSRFPKFW